MPSNQRTRYAYKSSRSPYARNPREQRPKKPKYGQYIDPSRFIKEAKPVTVENEYIPTHEFMDFAVDSRVLANLSRKGFTAPTPIQDETIPLGLEGKDIIGIANTG